MFLLELVDCDDFGEAEIRTALAVLLLTLNRSNRKSALSRRVKSKVRVLLRLLTGVKGLYIHINLHNINIDELV